MKPMTSVETVAAQTRVKLVVRVEVDAELNGGTVQQAGETAGRVLAAAFELFDLVRRLTPDLEEECGEIDVVKEAKKLIAMVQGVSRG